MQQPEAQQTSRETATEVQPAAGRGSSGLSVFRLEHLHHLHQRQMTLNALLPDFPN